MFRIKSLLLGAALALGTAVAAQASTVATFGISNGTWSVVDGNTITVTGDFAGDATGLAALDPSATLPLVFGATIGVNGSPVFAGDLGPLDLSVDDLVGIGTVIAGELDLLTGGAASAAFGYMTAGLGRTDPLDIFDFGVGDLFFSYTGGIFGPTLAGSFTAIITGNPANQATLSQIINAGLFDLGVTEPGGPLAGFIFPSNDSGQYSADFTISVVPLPASLPLLGAGLFGLFLVGRRRRAA